MNYFGYIGALACEMDLSNSEAHLVGDTLFNPDVYEGYVFYLKQRSATMLSAIEMYHPMWRELATATIELILDKKL